MLKIATFNVNSIRKRYANLAQWIENSDPDIVLLQEIKCQDSEFEALDISALGYHAISFGQKAYNGVAILSKEPLHIIARGLFVDSDDMQARFIAAETYNINIASLYCPNGNPINSDKFTYKLQWMQKLEDYVRQQVLGGENIWVLGGDYNICAGDEDFWDSAAMRDDALWQAESVACYRRLINLGLIDAWRALHPGERAYSFWDYQNRCYQKNHGLLIDRLLLSPEAADLLVSAAIEADIRGADNPSDHVPVVCSLRL